MYLHISTPMNSSVVPPDLYYFIIVFYRSYKFLALLYQFSLTLLPKILIPLMGRFVPPVILSTPLASLFMSFFYFCNYFLIDSDCFTDYSDYYFSVFLCFSESSVHSTSSSWSLFTSSTGGCVLYAVYSDHSTSRSIHYTSVV